MLARELKLRLTKKQEKQLSTMLFQCTGLYNTLIRKIKQDASDNRYYSEYDLYDLFVGHSKKTDLHSRTIQGIIDRAYDAWQRCFTKISGEPRLKGKNNKLVSIPFPDPLSIKKITKNRIQIPLIGKVRYLKQEIPEGKIKQLKVKRRASGWYVILTIDANNIFPVKDTEEKVGIDTGFKHLAVLSNGIKYENPRNYIKGKDRLAQAQRGKNKKLTARLHERIANRRRDYNHKVSREIMQNYKEIYITDDNLKGQAKKFGKSIGDAGIGQLRDFIKYKGDNHSRLVEPVISRKSTMTCSNCWSLTGPTGLSGLAVRFWECSVCGTVHDRDINSAVFTLKVGAGLALVPEYSGLNRNSVNHLELWMNPTAIAVGEVKCEIYSEKMYSKEIIINALFVKDPQMQLTTF